MNRLSYRTHCINGFFSTYCGTYIWSVVAIQEQKSRAMKFSAKLKSDISYFWFVCAFFCCKNNIFSSLRSTISKALIHHIQEWCRWKKKKRPTKHTEKSICIVYSRGFCSSIRFATKLEWGQNCQILHFILFFFCCLFLMFTSKQYRGLSSSKKAKKLT